MLKKYTCIVCPNGCEIEVNEGADGKLQIQGATCKRGEEYVTQEMTDPKRTIASSVSVEGGVLPLTSVRLTAPIAKDKIFDAMAIIKKIKLQAPVSMGEVLCENILGSGSDVIATRNVEKAGE